MSLLAKRFQTHTGLDLNNLTDTVTDGNGGRFSNPYYAIIEFQIGEMELHQLPPKHIQSFTCERATDSTTGEYNKFSISIFDDTGIEIEEMIANGYNNCKFRYGYSDGTKSSLFQAEITNYNLEFAQGKALINIEGISTGVAAMGVPKTCTYSGGYIHDYINEIAEDEGWEIGYIEDTKEVLDDSGNQKSYVRSSSDAITFITNSLVPESVSEGTGQSGYLLYFEDKEDSTYVYYCTPNWNNDTSKAIGTDELDMDSDKESYQFTWGSDERDSTVISFVPEFSGILTAVEGSEEVVASSVDPIRNEMFSISIKGTTTNKSMTSGSKGMKNNRDYKAVVHTSSCSYDELRSMSMNMLYATAAHSYPATLQIIGNPKIFPQRNCNIIVMLANGLMHHSSGDYLITGVTDEISGGAYTTTLKLVRSGLTIGVESTTVTESGNYEEGSGYTDAGVNTPSSGGGSYDTAGSGSGSYNNGGLNSSIYNNSVVVGGSNSNRVNVTLEGGNSTTNTSGNSGTAKCSNLDVLDIALGEIGYKEGVGNNTKYGIYTGTNYQPWCAAFVSWCANEAGVPGSVVPKFASCDVGMQWFINNNRFGDRSNYIPMEGDIIFFGTPQDSTHVGIVEGVEGSKVYTIEGNSSDQVIRRNYDLSNSKIIGYGSPAYANLYSNSNFNKSASIHCNEVQDDYSGSTSFSTNDEIGDYNDEDFRYLSAVISSEALTTHQQGQYAVGHCVLNRVRDSRFPNTIKEVVEAPGQFVSPWRNYLNNPKEMASESAKSVLLGTADNPIGDCIFFLCAATTKREGITVGGNLFFSEW